MIPVLYAANETQFNSMGIGVLADTISAHVVEERNGMFELEMVYPVSGPLYGEIQKDRLIKAKANDDANMDPQLFRIYSITRTMDDGGQMRVNVKAKHISYDLFYNPVKKFSVSGNAQAMLDAILSNTMYPHSFTGLSDDTTNASSTLEHVSARAALGGVEGSLLDRWRGEFTFDNHLIKFSQNRGTDTGIIVSYGKNLTDAEQEEVIDETYTSIYPYAKVGTGDDEQIIELPEKTLDSEYVGNYAFTRCLTVDLSGEDVTDEASLRSKAQRYLTDNQIGKPKVSLTVSFVMLWQTEEYKNVAPLEHINLCDWVTVRFKKLGIDVKAKVIKTDYDVLLERYITVDLGDPKANLADQMNDMQSGISSATSAAQQAITYAGQAIQHADGTWTFYSETEPAGDIREGSIWFKIINGGTVEMYRYNGVSWDIQLSKDANDAQNTANQALESANGKNKNYYSAEQPTGDISEGDRWFRNNADGTVTQFIYQGGQWINPVDDGVKAAQDQASDAVSRADAASAQATSAAQNALNATNTANSASTAASAAQQTASDAATQAQTAYNNAQTAMSDAQDALDGVSGLSSQVDTMQSDIADKADAAWVNGQLVAKADKATTYTKTETDNALNGKVSTTTYNTDQSGIVQRFENNESAINQNADNIATKVSNTTYNADKDTLTQNIASVDQKANGIRTDINSLTQTVSDQGTTISSQGSQINQLSDEISTKVSQTEFNNLQIGGRNLLPNSKSLSTLNGYPSSGNPTMNGEWRRFSLPLHDLTEVVCGYMVDVNRNTQYTESILFRTDCDDISFQFTFFSLEVGHQGIPATIVSLGNNLYKAYATYTTKSNQSVIRTPDINELVINGGSYIEFAYAKLEKGNKATDWSPAPEDKADQSDLNSLSGTVTTQGTAINQLSDSITLKADKTIVDTLSGKVDQQGTQISANTSAIALKASQSTVDTLSGQVSSNTAQLDVQANQIAARITEQDADSRYATQTALTATSSSLTSQISSVQTNLDGLSVDSRNLFLNSSFHNGLSHWVTWQDGGNAALVDDDESPSGKAIHATGRSGKYYNYSDVTIPMVVGEKYTISVMAKGSGTFRFGWEGSTVSSNDLSSDYTNKSYTFVFTHNRNFSFYAFSQDADIYYHSIKLSKSNRNTGWSPAPEDMATAAQFTSLSQTLTGFQTTVQNEYAQKSMVTQTATVLQSSIDAKVDTDVYNSKISQLSNDINLRVSKNDVINQINVSTEGILIDGSKTHITGQTTIDNAVITNAMIAALDAGKITTGTLNANRIGANSITADKLDVANLAAISANLGTVTAGTLNAVTVNSAHFNGGWIDGTNLHVKNNETDIWLNFDGFALNNNSGFQAWLNEDGLNLLKNGEWVFNVDSDGNVNERNVSMRTSVRGTDIYISPDNGLVVDNNNGYQIFMNDYGFNINNRGNVVFDSKSNGDMQIYGIQFSYSGIYLGNANVVSNCSEINMIGKPEDWNFTMGVNNEFQVKDAWSTHYMGARASAWNVDSQFEHKQNIEDMQDGEALTLVNKADIESYRLISESERGIDKVKYGMIIGGGYSTPDAFLDSAREGIDLYSSVSLSIKAIQDLSKLHQKDVLKIAELEQRISQLEAA